MSKCLFVVSCLGLLSLASCKQKTSAGWGGNAVLRLEARHHGVLIDSCTFSIKFNASDLPAEYDFTQQSITDSSGSYVVISGLKEGDYYLFASGWDPSISQTVKGGMPYTIRSESEQRAAIAVTE